MDSSYQRSLRRLAQDIDRFGCLDRITESLRYSGIAEEAELNYSNITTAQDLLQELTKRGIIGPGNLRRLEEVAEILDRRLFEAIRATSAWSAVQISTKGHTSRPIAVVQPIGATPTVITHSSNLEEEIVPKTVTAGSSEALSMLPKQVTVPTVESISSSNLDIFMLPLKLEDHPEEYRPIMDPEASMVPLKVGDNVEASEDSMDVLKVQARVPDMPQTLDGTRPKDRRPGAPTSPQDDNQPLDSIEVLKVGTEERGQRRFPQGVAGNSPETESLHLHSSDSGHRSPIVLYNYQRELAAPALDGKNCIICAPTGSGKTFTAGYICREMWKNATMLRHRFKVLFIVCMRTLIMQQQDALKQVFSDNPEVVTGIDHTTPLAVLLQSYDVVVVTAQIVVNSLKNKELTLADVDLMVMDECHHTDLLHPYNAIMDAYHTSKRQHADRSLPRIVGLTASLGVGDSDKAIEHYIHMCANLDCTHITHVRDAANRRELLQHNPKPSEDQIVAVGSRHPDDFARVLVQMMWEILRATPVISNLVGIPGMSRPNPGDQSFENWFVQARKLAEERDLQYEIYACSTLLVMNKALLFTEELQLREVVPLLQAHFSEVPDAPSHAERRIHDIYPQRQADLERLADVEQIEDNPKLRQLYTLLKRMYTEDHNSKGILLTRTRHSVTSLIKFIDRQAAGENFQLIKAHKLVGQGSKEGSITDTEQERILARFRKGMDDPDGINLLVATDIAQEGLDMPKCNFVIRYNFVSNEIGSVQSRGRARAKNSKCYLIVNHGSLNHKREIMNIRKELNMLEALDEIDRRKPAELTTAIKRKQVELWSKKPMDTPQRRPQNDAADITIHCKNCKALLCEATDMVHRGSNFIAINPELEDRIKEIPKGIRDFRYDTQDSRLECGNSSCQHNLGVGLTYKQGSRHRGMVLSKDGVMWKRAADRNFSRITKWSKVPFDIPTEEVTD